MRTHWRSVRELFVDEYLIDTMDGVTRKRHSPQPQGAAIEFDSPWDGSCSHYVTIFQDDDRYRMYYRGYPWVSLALAGPTKHAVTCYAESRDGIHWEKPNLGLFEDDHTGTKNNNIVMVSTEKWPNVTHNFTVFKDTNPDCPPDARYKAVGRHFLGSYHVGNLGFQSPDGIHWRLIQDEVIFEERGHVFDAHNIVFWDSQRQAYVEYHRKFRRDVPGAPADWSLEHPMAGYRDVRTSTSTNFTDWTEPRFLEYGGAPGEHFNHLLVLPYFRAPHIYLGFGDRLVETRDDFLGHPASGISDGVFLSSRDGVNFDRGFMEAWIRPGLDVKNWMHAGASPAWGLLQTGPEELSVYWIQNYYQPDVTCYLERGTLRLDGFVSVKAPYAGGEFTTQPLTFEGRELVLNFSSSAVGSVQVEIQDRNANPVSGFTLADCPPIYGDAIEQAVSWSSGSDLSALAGQVVRLRFVMKDADLYSIRFRE